jgi:small subunit ribosomal protein S11
MASKSVSRLRPSSICPRCRHLFATLQSRYQFSTSKPTAEDKHSTYVEKLKSGSMLGKAFNTPKTQEQSMREMQRQQQITEAQANHQRFAVSGRRPMTPELTKAQQTAVANVGNRPTSVDAFGDLHHLHVYSTRRNTHVTLTRPNREPMLSLSCGNLNFRKAQRGTFDAAYQLVSYTMTQIVEKGFMQKIQKIEVLMRGYGPGREAFQKVLLGTEGKLIRQKVQRVTDSTRLKFGGTRSPNVRRL